MYCTLCGEIPGPGPLVARTLSDGPPDPAEATPAPTGSRLLLDRVLAGFRRGRGGEPPEGV
jgi:hypothetical protein